MCAPWVKVSSEATREFQIPESGIREGSELPDIGAGNYIHGLWKSDQDSESQSLSPALIFSIILET